MHLVYICILAHGLTFVNKNYSHLVNYFYRRQCASVNRIVGGGAFDAPAARLLRKDVIPSEHSEPRDLRTNST